MAIKGSDLVSRARVVLHDPSGGTPRWTDAEFVLWVNDACKYVATQRPDAAVVNAELTMIAGFRQSIASMAIPGVRLLDVLFEVTTGRDVELVDRRTLGAHRPAWRNDASGVVENYLYDNRDPTNFEVWPPAVNGAKVRVLYTRVPVQLANTGELASVDLTINDLYSDALLNYVLFRCYAKDADATHNAELAALYLQACNASLGVKTSADVAASPDMNSPGGKPAPGATIGGV
jgi:hypothetical protein